MHFVASTINSWRARQAHACFYLFVWFSFCAFFRSVSVCCSGPVDFLLSFITFLFLSLIRLITHKTQNDRREQMKKLWLCQFKKKKIASREQIFSPRHFVVSVSFFLQLTPSQMQTKWAPVGRKFNDREKVIKFLHIFNSFFSASEHAVRMFEHALERPLLHQCRTILIRLFIYSLSFTIFLLVSVFGDVFCKTFCN